MGASGASSRQIFELSRQVVKKIIEEESLPRVRYGVVLYGQESHTVVNLDDFPERSSLIDYISQMNQPQAGRSYENGILKALEVFTEQGNPNAERTIMLFTNSRSNASPTEMAAIKDQLLRTRTRLIVVDIGGDGENVRGVAPNDQDIIRVSATDSSWHIVQVINNVVVKGKIPAILFLFCAPVIIVNYSRCHIQHEHCHHRHHHL
jgi:uncharacterized protein YfkK (UPF0435 family)